MPLLTPQGQAELANGKEILIAVPPLLDFVQTNRRTFIGQPIR
jgi:hypothetical protein